MLGIYTKKRRCISVAPSGFAIGMPFGSTVGSLRNTVRQREAGSVWCAVMEPSPAGPQSILISYSESAVRILHHIGEITDIWDIFVIYKCFMGILRMIFLLLK